MLDAVWGDQFVSESALSSRIKTARRAVGDDGKRQEVIKTLHGHGFRFVAPVVGSDNHRPKTPERAGVAPSRRTLAAAPPKLFGRAGALEAVFEVLRETQAGNGQVVVVRGEAGLGKTALLQTFLDGIHPDTADVSVAGCVSLRTPELLSPIVELAEQIGVDQGALPGRLTASAIARAAVTEVAKTPVPNVLVVEDLHWADDATLDAIVLLARWLRPWPVLLVLSTRPSEGASAHPILGVLADLRSLGATVLELEPLSADALRDWAEEVGVAAPQLIEQSGGNALLATEILSAPADDVPDGVRDSVVGRLARLSPTGRHVVQTLSMSPQPIETHVAMKALGGGFEALAEIEHAGLVAARGDTVAFQHELVRLAVHDSVSTFARVAMHRELFDALDQQTDARAIHHAAEALMVDTVAELAPAAARRATDLQAHRQAHGLYEHALKHEEMFDDFELAQLKAEHARTLYILWELEASAHAATEAVELLKTLDRPLALGDAMTTLARVELWLGQSRSFTTITDAIAILETQPPGRELCRAYCETAGILVVGDLASEADAYAAAGYDLAVEIGDRALQGLALNYTGAANLVDSRQAALRQSLELLGDSTGRDYAGRVYSNLMVTLWEIGELQEAYELLGEAQDRLSGVEYTSAVMNIRLQGAHINQSLGNLGEALAHLEWVTTTALAASFAFEVNLLRDRIHMRMGEASAKTTIRTLWANRHDEPRLSPLESVEAAGQLSRYPVLQLMTAAAEVAVRDNDTGLAAEVAVLANAQRFPPTWVASRHELALYLSLAGQSVTFASDTEGPFLSALNGDLQIAAKGFDELGRVFDARACRGELD
ncbi:MAG: AAA family ATPase [Acidimicrobiales bacterium]